MNQLVMVVAASTACGHRERFLDQCVLSVDRLRPERGYFWADECRDQAALSSLLRNISLLWSSGLSLSAGRTAQCCVGRAVSSRAETHGTEKPKLTLS
jgi:hypothetical protein